MSAATDWITAVGALVTGASASITSVVWIRGQTAGWLEQRRQRRLYAWPTLTPGSIAGWHVRLAEDPGNEASPRAALEVLNAADGTPDVNRAAGLRAIVDDTHKLSRSPTPGEYELLHELQAKGLPEIQRTWWERLLRVR